MAKEQSSVKVRVISKDDFMETCAKVTAKFTSKITGSLEQAKMKAIEYAFILSEITTELFDKQGE